MRKLMIKQLERLAAEHADQFIASMMVSTKSIIDMAEFVRELEQNAEAAEAKLADEKKINSKLRDDRAGLSRECNGFEAKLKDQNELIHSLQETVYRYSGPAPAVNLADLVPQKMTNPHQIAAEGTGWNDCIDAIIRNIEEATNGQAIPAAKVDSVADTEVQAGSEASGEENSA